MAASKNQVFLMQGEVALGEGEMALAGVEIEQRVVVAQDLDSAMLLVNGMTPEFKLLGLATLQEYEATAVKLRATLNGENTGWKLFVAPGMG